jgi:hypothetical protein
MMGRAHLLRSIFIGAASVLLVLQLPSGYSQNEREPVTPATGGQTGKDAADVNAFSLGTGNGSKPGVPLTGTGGGSSSSISHNGEAANVKTYGAVGDGKTNDSAAFKAALKSVADAGGGVCLVPKGTYIISASGITRLLVPAVSSGVHLIGEAREESVLKVDGMPRNHLLQCDGDDWTVENLTFDMGDYTPSVGLVAIACKGSNWRVSNCAIVKSGRWGIAAFGGSNWSIEGNYIRRTVPGARPPRGAILVTAAKPGVWPDHGRVIDNVCEGGGITFTGSNGIVARNRVSGSGSGSGIFVPGFPGTHAPTITGNVCSDGSSGYDAAQGGRWWSVNGFEIWAPDSVIYNNIAHDNDGGGFAIGGQNSIVVGNKSYNNGRGRAGHAGFVARVNPAKGASASHSIFIANVAYDTRYPSTNATQDYGYLEQAAGVTDIKHFKNDYNRNRIGPAKFSSAGGQMQISPEMKSKLKALAEDGDITDSARRIVREYLSR